MIYLEDKKAEIYYPLDHSPNAYNEVAHGQQGTEYWFTCCLAEQEARIRSRARIQTQRFKSELLHQKPTLAPKAFDLSNSKNLGLLLTEIQEVSRGMGWDCRRNQTLVLVMETFRRDRMVSQMVPEVLPGMPCGNVDGTVDCPSSTEQPGFQRLNEMW